MTDVLAGWNGASGGDSLEFTGTIPAGATDLDRPAYYVGWQRIRNIPNSSLTRLIDVDQTGGGNPRIDISIQDLGAATNAWRIRANKSGAVSDAIAVDDFAVVDELSFIAGWMSTGANAGRLFKALPTGRVIEASYRQQTAGSGTIATIDGYEFAGRIGSNASAFEGDLYALAIILGSGPASIKELEEIRRMDPREWPAHDRCVASKLYDRPPDSSHNYLTFAGNQRRLATRNGTYTPAEPVTLADLGITRRRDRVNFAAIAAAPFGIFAAQPRVVHEVF